MRLGGLARFIFDESEFLVRLGSEGEDEAAGVGELGRQGGRDAGGGAGDEDGVVRGSGRPAGLAVGGVNVDVLDVLGGEGVGGALCKGRDGLEGVDFGDESGEDGGLIAATGANLEDAVVWLGGESLGHEGDNVGLRDGLAMTDGEGCVVVGFGSLRFGDKEVARGFEHGLEDAGVGDVAGGRA